MEGVPGAEHYGTTDVHNEGKVGQPGAGQEAVQPTVHGSQSDSSDLVLPGGLRGVQFAGRCRTDGCG